MRGCVIVVCRTHSQDLETATRSKKNMKELWKVKGFEKQTSWTVSVPDCVFSSKMNKKSETDTSDAREIAFFFFFFIFLLSSSFPPPLFSLFCLLSLSLSVSE